MSEPRLTRLSKLDGEASATALAKYLLEASDAAALAGYLSIIVNVPKPFSLTIAEARAIADRLAGKDLRDARARIAELEVALRWARKFATGFDHLRGCPRRNPDSPPCSCGYDTIITPLDEVLVRGRPDE